ncbi:MAG: type I-E CRISPR-associated protein Cse1/CasA [Candidatus Thiodiazotropha sp.]
MTNLILDYWLPVRRASGAKEMITPWQITDRHEQDPIVALNTPRADFNGSLMQFLIGLLQTAVPPEKAYNEDWLDWLDKAPKPELLKEKFLTLQHAFNLDDDGPRFLQDFDELKGDTKPIDALLIEAPGANALRNNTDHFIKRDGVQGLCPACVASALFTLQTNAPSGGAGHRTSLRGGGPLTTLAMIDPGDQVGLTETLWRNLWLNVLSRYDFEALSDGADKQADFDIFPWLTSTRTSDAKQGGKDTYPDDVNPLQMYWAMPRRIRLDWNNLREGECDICGVTSNRLVIQYTTQNYGINYSGPWKHPLSPHSLNKTDNTPLPRHPQPGGLTYRHWLRFVADEELSEAARVITAFNKRNPDNILQLRLWAFGYDMDNMKARCWYETLYPLYLLDDTIRGLFIQRVQSLVSAAVEISGYVRSAIKEAWFKRPGDAKGDTSFLVEAFFQKTENEFFSLSSRLESELGADSDGVGVLNFWHGILEKAAMALFDYWSTHGDVSVSNPRRIAIARNNLKKRLKAKRIKKLLQLPDSKEKAA